MLRLLFLLRNWKEQRLMKDQKILQYTFPEENLENIIIRLYVLDFFFVGILNVFSFSYVQVLIHVE